VSHLRHLHLRHLDAWGWRRVQDGPSRSSAAGPWRCARLRRAAPTGSRRRRHLALQCGPFGLELFELGEKQGGNRSVACSKTATASAQRKRCTNLLCSQLLVRLASVVDRHAGARVCPRRDCAQSTVGHASNATTPRAVEDSRAPLAGLLCSKRCSSVESVRWVRLDSGFTLSILLADLLLPAAPARPIFAVVPALLRFELQ
jgi:hypothetical protein